MPSSNTNVAAQMDFWNAEKHEQMRADPASWPMIWLLVTKEEAECLTHGEVTEALAQQAEKALA